ncbi:hypothetical protein [Streptomyces diacarni]|uniref:hypothetical protein n=1 Tax=Streptomyces diacarni TaxID=2800381 RepID=UPI0015F044C1|nr:hypothetical protein [Streptomyces diacarni]
MCQRLFRAYATRCPLPGNHRWDALDFAGFARERGRLARRWRASLKRWRLTRLGPAPR